MNDKNYLVIDAKGSATRYWRELYEHRELFFFIAWRDILVRYKQTVIGIFWSVLRPVLTMIVFSVVFGRFAGMPSEGSVPYALLVLAGLLPWQLFSNAVQIGSDSIIVNADMIMKVYFPRLIFPLTGMMTALVDFFIALGVYFVMMLYYQVFPHWQILMLPFLIALALLVSAGVCIFTSALNSQYRDFHHIVPFALQFGLYVSPIGFPLSVVPEHWRFLYSLNPMVGIIEGFRWVLLGQHVDIYWPSFMISILISFALLWVGIKTFRSMEKTMADKV